jgi:exonuclease SbcC
MDAVRAELEQAERAGPLLPGIQALDVLRGEIAAMERTVDAKALERAALAADQQHNERLLEAHRADEPRHEAAIAESRRLEDLRPRVQQLERAVRERAAAEEARASVEGAVAAAARSFEAQAARAAAIEALLPELRATAGGAAALEAHLKELRQVESQVASLAAAAGELQAWEAAMAGARAARAAAAADASAAERAAQEARSRWLRSRAGALAAQLAAGAPCPVCGSTEHPAPAAPGADDVTEERLQALEEARRAAHERERAAGAQEAEAAVKAAEFGARAQGLRESLGEHAGTAAAQIRRASAEKSAALAAAVVAGEQVAGLERELADLRDAMKGAADARGPLEERARQAADAAIRAAAAVEHLEGVLPEQLRSGVAIEQRLQELAAAVAAWRESLRALELERERLTAGLGACDGFLVATRVELEAKRLRGEQAAGELAARLAQAGFATDTACRAAARSDRQVAALQERLAAFNNTVQQAQGALEEARRKVVGLPPPELASLEARRAGTAAALQACGQELGRLQEQHRALAARLRELDELERDEAAVAVQSEALREIAAAAAGDNSTKMRFSTYALAAYFDEVMAHTNRRLAAMSAGRYTLARATDAAGRGFKGLDLEVLDAYTDRVRPANTLSGGEGFLAALALALGLADAVQAAAGGFKLESVFIDEGFGSLDAESLELAQRCIMDLQAAGRMVGLISHVEEMSSWTPARIRIAKTPRGSTILS